MSAPSPAASASLPTAELIDHILTRYHEVHRAQLPVLLELAQRVESVHKAHPLAPTGVHSHLQQMAQELLMHMDKEEHILFPMLRTNLPVAGPIQVMRNEHADHETRLHTLQQLIHQGELAAEACQSWRRLYAAIAEFAADLRSHIDIENQQLFTRFEQAHP